MFSYRMESCRVLVFLSRMDSLPHFLSFVTFCVNVCIQSIDYNAIFIGVELFAHKIL